VFGKFFVKVQADRYIVGLRTVARIDVAPISATRGIRWCRNLATVSFISATLSQTGLASSDKLPPSR